MNVLLLPFQMTRGKDFKDFIDFLRMQVFKRITDSVGSPTWQYLGQGHSDSMVSQYAPYYSSLTNKNIIVKQFPPK